MRFLSGEGIYRKEITALIGITWKFAFIRGPRTAQAVLRDFSGDTPLVEIVWGHFQRDGIAISEFGFRIREGFRKVAEHYLAVDQLDPVDDFPFPLKDGSGGLDGGFGHGEISTEIPPPHKPGERHFPVRMPENPRLLPLSGGANPWRGNFLQQIRLGNRLNHGSG